MISKWIIKLKGFELYRFDEVGNLWKLPFESENGKRISLKKVAKEKCKKRWEFSINGKRQKWSENQIRPHLVKDINPIILIQEKGLPF